MRHCELLFNAMCHRYAALIVVFVNDQTTNPPSGGQASGLLIYYTLRKIELISQVFKERQ